MAVAAIAHSGTSQSGHFRVALRKHGPHQLSWYICEETTSLLRVFDCGVGCSVKDVAPFAE